MLGQRRTATTTKKSSHAPGTSATAQLGYPTVKRREQQAPPVFTTIFHHHQSELPDVCTVPSFSVYTLYNFPAAHFFFLFSFFFLITNSMTTRVVLLFFCLVQQLKWSRKRGQTRLTDATGDDGQERKESENEWKWKQILFSIR